MITISCNGNTLSLEAPLNIAQLLKQQGYQQQKIAIAINQTFIPRSQYAKTQLQAGDQIDIIQAVGGG